jgi:hypothetical protein
VRWPANPDLAGTDAVPGTATTTTLSVAQVPLPLGLGGCAFPTAHVSPLAAAGTVQFKDGTTNLGVPVAVIAGTALGPFTQLSPGPHSLTAVFIPTDPTKFQSSLSNAVTFTF